MGLMKFDLKPVNGAKSFYGKAKVLQDSTGYTLYSYDTAICHVDLDGGLSKIWHGYSTTTMKHINSFLVFCGKEQMNKAEWLAI